MKKSPSLAFPQLKKLSSSVLPDPVTDPESEATKSPPARMVGRAAERGSGKKRNGEGREREREMEEL